jgi:serine/threonine protein phosphatase PrpC
MVEDTALAGLLTGASDLSATLQQLVDAANAAGGEDNISAILARLTVEEQE